MTDSWAPPPAEREPALQNGTNGNHVTVPGRDPEKRAAAAAQGWVEPQAYNYSQEVPAVVTGGGNNGAEFNLGEGEEVPGWMHRAAKYEWKEEYGDVGPEVPELEKILFGSELRTKKGIKFDQMLSIKVVAEATERPAPIRSFKDAGLHPQMLDNVIKSGYDVPTPIQAYAIPAVLKGHDVIAVAQTGSGKTAAFMVPVLSKLMGKAKKLCAPRPNYLKPDFDLMRHGVRAEPLVLIIAPTRELCIQTFDESRRLCYRSMLRPCVAYGGGPIREQRDDLRKGCDVLIATPGRLRDFMKDGQLLSLHRLRFTIIDEADEMLHEDWAEDLEEIFHGADANIDGQHQYLLFSATFDKAMRTSAKKYLAQDYVRIRIGRSGSTISTIKQMVVWVDKNRKKQALYDLLLASPPARTLIFVKTKKSVDFVDDFLFNQGLPTTSIHSDRTQLEREDAIRAFRRGTAPIMITTSVSARGLDVRNVMHVINYDLPSIDHNGQDDYIHRIGRTGRAGNEGLATSFYNEDDEPMAPFLTKILVENGFDVPEFLEEYKPAEGEDLDFNDDSGDEENEPANNSSAANEVNDAWGADSGESTTAPAEDNTWGSGPAAATTNGEDSWGTANATGTSNGGGW